MKTSFKYLPGVLLAGLTLGCSEPDDASELTPPPVPMSLAVAVDVLVRPSSNTATAMMPPELSGAEASAVHAANNRTGSQEFGLAPVTNERGEVDLNALTAALQTYVADRMVPVNSIKDLKILVDEKFLASLPAPPAGMKYVWDNRLQVTLAAN